MSGREKPALRVRCPACGAPPGLATATFLYPKGFGIDPEREEDRETCDSLVKRGSLIALQDVEGGYRLSDELANAVAVDTARTANAAQQN